MPTSTYAHIGQLVSNLSEIRPDSILDIGLGNGKMGFIARDLLDTMLGERYLKKEWQVRIDGIEVFSDYIQEHQKFIYDDIYVGNALEVIDTLGCYDVIILGDVLEHFSKEDGGLLLSKCLEKSVKSLIINLPLGNVWEQGAIYGNPYETHRSHWEKEEFASLTDKIWTYDFSQIGGEYAFIRLDKREVLNRLFEKSKSGEREEGLKELLKGAVESDPQFLECHLMLADLHTEEGNIGEGIICLEKMLRVHPHYEYGYELLGRLQKVAQRRAPSSCQPVSHG